MEEAPRSEVQERTAKLEQLKERMMEKHFPGLRAELDQALAERKSQDDPAFWEQVERLLETHNVNEESLRIALEDR